MLLTGEFPCCNSFQYTSSYHIPFRSVCNGYIDCSYGNHEVGCDNYICMDMLKCSHSSHFVHQVCDGVSHCTHGDDDRVCGLVPGHILC